LDFISTIELIAVPHVSSNVPFFYALFTRLFYFDAHDSLQLLSLTKLILQAVFFMYFAA
jgi:hypothetical protein